MLVSWGKKFKRQKDTEKFEYDMFYLWLKACIEKYELHRDNYSFLKSKLLELSELKHKDVERTQVLTTMLYRRFERFSLDDIGPEEHSIYACFGESDWY